MSVGFTKLPVDNFALRREVKRPTIEFFLLEVIFGCSDISPRSLRSGIDCKQLNESTRFEFKLGWL
jgi:hypothetical protein